MQDLSIAVSGMGRWGNQWLEVLATHPGVVLAATAGGHVRQMPKNIDTAPNYRHYADFAEMLNSVTADVSLITLPIPHHASAIEQSLRAGMHVLCEKPLVTNRDDLERVLTAAAEHKDRVVMVSQNYRQRPWARAARHVVESGVLGHVAHVDVRFSQPEFLDGGRDQLRSPLLEDMSIHHFDLIRYLTGSDAAEVVALEHRPPWSAFPGNPSLEVLLRMADGSIVTYSGTWAGRGPSTSFDGDVTLYGERGTLIWRNEQFTLNGEPFNPSDAGWESAPEYPVGGDADLHAVLADFRRAVLRGERAETDLADNYNTVELLLAVEQSALSGEAGLRAAKLTGRHS